MFHNHIHNCCSTHFPKIKNTYRKHSHISDSTRSLAKQRDRQIVLVKNLKSELGIIYIPRECFAHRAVEKLQGLNKDVRKSVIADWNRVIEGFSEKINESDLLHRSRETYVFMRKLQKRKPVKPTIMIGPNGEIVQDPMEARLAFQARLVELTHAAVMEPHQLFNFYNSIHICFTASERQHVEAYLPSVSQLACIYAAIKKHKAGGEDPTPPDLTREFPVEFAENLHPTVISAMCECKEPLFWAGGVAHELLKGFQSGSKASQYRFVLLSDVGGKVYHKYLRQCITTYIDTYILSTMCGGFLKRGTDFASLYLKVFCEACRVSKASYGALFLDVSAAFESLQHWLVFGSRPSDTTITSTFSKLGFDREIFQDFQAASLEPSAFSCAGVPPVLDKLVASAHRVSWFSTEGLKNVAVATQGRLQGRRSIRRYCLCLPYDPHTS